MPTGKPTNLREMERRHERQLVWLAAAMLLVGGGLLIALIWGWGRLLGALPFLALGAEAVVALYALVGWLPRWAEQ